MNSGLKNILVFTSLAAVITSGLIAVLLILGITDSIESKSLLIKILGVLATVALVSIISLFIIKTSSK